MALTWTDTQAGTNLLPVPSYIRNLHIDEIRAYLDGHINLAAGHPMASASTNGFMSSSHFSVLETYIASGNGIMGVGVTAPLVSTGASNNPTISISAATTSAAGSMSSADKLKLDSAGDLPARLVALEARPNTSGTVTGITSNTPAVTITSGATPQITIANADATKAGLFTSAEKAKLATMDGFPVGSIIMWHGDSTAFGTLFNGSGIGLETGAFAKWKILWGTVNAAPLDMRNIFPMGADSPSNANRASGTKTYSLNGSEIEGEPAHKLTSSEMPIHNHYIDFSGHSTANPEGGGLVVSGANGTEGITGFNTNNTGGDTPHNNMPPFIRLYFLYKYTA